MNFNRKVSHYAVYLGVLACLFAAIWTPGASSKWVLTAAYIHLVGRYFGLTRNEFVIGSKLPKDKFLIKNFLPMRRK